MSTTCSQWAIRLAVLLASLMAPGCSDEVARCVPRASVACTCPGGRAGGQVCADDGTFGRCECDVDAAVPLDSAGGGSGDASAADTGRPDAAPDVLPGDVGSDPMDGAIDAPTADVVDAADSDHRVDAAIDVAPVDATSTDVTPADVTPADVGTIADAPTPPVETCAGTALLDATREGITRGATTVVRGSSLVATAMSQLTTPTGCAVGAGNPVVVRYTLRTRARLNVSTMSANTGFDTVVWALDHCAADGRTLGCNDDMGRDASMPLASPFGSTALLGDTFPAGTTVFVVVAGARGAAGTFELAITEVPPTIALGSTCTPEQKNAACVAGATCVTPYVTGYGVTEARCVANGARLGACRTTGAPCDAGLACDGNPWTPTARCLPVLPVGASCVEPRTAYDVVSICDGLCAWTIDGGRCVGDGSAQGRCRTSGEACLPGLVCTGVPGEAAARCMRPPAPGSSCSFGNPLSGCSAGERCVPTSAPYSSGGSPGRCVRVGAESGACRDGATRCDEGLACTTSWTTSLCRPLVAIGASCDVSHATNACATGSTCLVTPAGPRCVPDGADGGECRLGTRPCDPGLRCNRARARCLPTVAPGAPCDIASVNNLCTEGSSCVGAASAQCTADGAAGSRCRSTGAQPCDAGLACNSQGFCRPALAAASRCSDAADSDACPLGTACVSIDTGRFCVDDGSLNGRCRTAGPRCDAGLTCASDNFHDYRCRALSAEGGSCGSSSDCPDGTICTTVPAVGQQCRRLGTDGGWCHPPFAGVASCDAGLACQGSTCYPSAPLGGVCSFFTARIACVAGSSCDGWVDSMGTGHCVAHGTALGLCRTSGAPCDAGLACSALNGRCIPVSATGGPCDDQERRGICVPGTRCWTGGVCTVAGRLDGPCRADAANLSCDAGLVCLGSVCGTGVAEGGRCSSDFRGGDNCLPGLECTSVGTASPTCTRSPYVWTAAAGASLIDACDGGIVVPPQGSSEAPGWIALPFAYRWFGNAVDGLLLTQGGFGALTAGSAPVTLCAACFPGGADQNAFSLGLGSGTGALCVKTIGATPNRQVVVEWLGAGSSATVVEAVLEEATAAIEFRYGPSAPGAAASASSYPGLGYGRTRSVLARTARVAAGNSIRFVPR